jgi:D-arginine dehydrogenase
MIDGLAMQDTVCTSRYALSGHGANAIGNRACLCHTNSEKKELPHYDIAVIGAGIAGASVAARLALQGQRVVLLEMENQPGYHTTGRSAAVFAPGYGPAPIRSLTRASEDFFLNPPDGFTGTALFSPRPIMMLARSDQRTALESLQAELDKDDGAGNNVSLVDAQALRDANPLVRHGYAEAALIDKAGQDIDVAALHQGFLALYRYAGGKVICGAKVEALYAGSQGWTIETKSAGDPLSLSAQLVVNAAGAWADQLGVMAGAESIGLVPKRRTAAMIEAPAQSGLSGCPITIDIDEQFYLKPDTGRLLISPADETPVEAYDAQPEELDLAICVDRIETAFDLQVKKIEHKWAGLRSFVADKSPVAGYSAKVRGFYWLAGQGGYGIQSSPALSEFAAAQILGKRLPGYIVDQGLEPGDLAPSRLANSS